MITKGLNAGRVPETANIVAELPEEFQDSGRVRVGAAIHINWATWEILHRLLQIWQGGGH